MKRMECFRWLCCMAIIFFPAMGWSGDKHAAFELDDTRWQVLPDQIKSVHVGPDDRAWFQVIKEEVEPDYIQIKEVIAEQFDKASPMLQNAYPVLFEDNGRVWFSESERRLLLGYDGESWIEKEAPAGQSFFHGWLNGCTLE